MVRAAAARAAERVVTPPPEMLGTVFLTCVCFSMFFLVYVILFGGSDFHERDFIGYLFNRFMGGLGVLLSKVGTCNMHKLEGWVMFAQIDVCVCVCIFVQQISFQVKDSTAVWNDG